MTHKNQETNWSWSCGFSSSPWFVALTLPLSSDILTTETKEKKSYVNVYVYLHSQHMHNDTDGWPDCCWGLAIIQSQLICETSSWTDRSWHLDHLKEINTQHSKTTAMSTENNAEGKYRNFLGNWNALISSRATEHLLLHRVCNHENEILQPPPEWKVTSNECNQLFTCSLSFIVHQREAASLWLWVCDKAGSNKHTKPSLNVLLH